MDHRRAMTALALAEGVARDDPTVDQVLVQAFDDMAQAAEAHAYLAGFLLQTLASASSEPIANTATYVRSLLQRSA